MWETCEVQIKVRLPRDVAAQAEVVQKEDPEFLSRVVLYGLTRRSIYRHLREQGQTDPEPEKEGGPEGNLNGAHPEELSSALTH